MDETPEELEQIRREAGQIDVNRYRRRRQAFYAVLLGALAAGVVWVVFEAVDKRRNPCERVRNHYCQTKPDPLSCAAYEGVFKESTADSSETLRRNVRHHCQRKIERLKSEQGIVIP